MHAVCYDGCYYGWCGDINGTKCIIFDPRDSMASTSTVPARAVYYDVTEDYIYLSRLDGSSHILSRWTPNALLLEPTNKLKLTWRSKIHQLPKAERFKWARIVADSYPVDGSGSEIVFKFYENGALVHTCEVFSREPVILPKLTPQQDWEWQIESYVGIDWAGIATSIEELRR
jgi:hypothetical protein